ncbi:hypothetical protein B7486_67165 [cyanobacterium TDX16]|nr:hypothetical protein B7486_67165 [cyanobacterium TDX16]
MAEIDDVLQRLEDDPGFRGQVEKDPATALEAYELSADDLGRVVEAVVGDTAPTEQRTLRSAFFALIARKAAEERGHKPPPASPPGATPF